MSMDIKLELDLVDQEEIFHLHNSVRHKLREQQMKKYLQSIKHLPKAVVARRIPPMFGYVSSVWEDLDKGTWGWHHVQCNLVINNSRNIIAHLLTSPQTARHISEFRIGTGGNAGDILAPIAPQRTDADLNDESPFVKAITEYSMLPAGEDVVTEIMFPITIDPIEANNVDGTPKVYSEAGLYTGSGGMFSRETFEGYIKTPSRRLTFLWSLEFAT